jgi:hypothetical protein
MHPEQKRIYQSMTPEQKLKVAIDLYYSAWELKLESLRAQNPNLPEKDIQAMVRETFLYART